MYTSETPGFTMRPTPRSQVAAALDEALPANDFPDLPFAEFSTPAINPRKRRASKRSWPTSGPTFPVITRRVGDA